MQLGIRHTGLDYICISHLHGDHYFGLIGLLSSMSLMGRKQPLHLIGPPPLKKIIDLQLLHGGHPPDFDIVFHPTNPNSPEFVVKTPSFELSTFPLKHRIHCTGFLIKEGKKDRPLNMNAMEHHSIPVAYYRSIKTGNDYTDVKGTTIMNNELTFDPKPLKSYAYCSDTIFDLDIVEYIRESTLLYHEATYMEALIEKASDRYHSTAIQAATIAKHAGVHKLIIGHFSSRYDNLEPLLLEAKTVFEHTELALEGVKFLIDDAQLQSMRPSLKNRMN